MIEILNLNYRILFFVISSVLGSGMFFTAYNLQQSEISGFVGLFCAGFVAACVGYCFGQCKESLFRFIERNLGDFAGFVAAWVYWFVCCTSTIVVLNDLVINLKTIFPVLENYSYFVVTQIVLVLFITHVNFYKNKFTSILEMSLNIMKLIPVLVLFVLCLYYSKIDLNLINQGSVSLEHTSVAITKLIWCFAGIECGCFLKTEQGKTKEILIGIFVVTFIYFLTFCVCFGVLGYNISNLMPLSDVAYSIFGSWGLTLCSVFVALINLGSLNIWIIGGGEVGYDNYKSGYFPSFFGVKNKNDVNFISLGIAGYILIPLCFFPPGDSLRDGVDLISNGFLFFYLLFVLSYFIAHKTLFSFLLLLCIVMFFIYNLTPTIFIFFTALIVFGLLLRRVFRNYYNLQPQAS